MPEKRFTITNISEEDVDLKIRGRGGSFDLKIPAGDVTEGITVHGLFLLKLAGVLDKFYVVEEKKPPEWLKDGF